MIFPARLMICQDIRFLGTSGGIGGLTGNRRLILAQAPSIPLEHSPQAPYLQQEVPAMNKPG